MRFLHINCCPIIFSKNSSQNPSQDSSPQIQFRNFVRGFFCPKFFSFNIQKILQAILQLQIFQFQHSSKNSSVSIFFTRVHTILQIKKILQTIFQLKILQIKIFFTQCFDSKFFSFNILQKILHTVLQIKKFFT